MNDQKCYNCGNPKSHHSKHDTHCLLVNNWKAEDFEPRPCEVEEPVTAQGTTIIAQIVEV